jgi:hypothetical protein
MRAPLHSAFGKELLPHLQQELVPPVCTETAFTEPLKALLIAGGERLKFQKCLKLTLPVSYKNSICIYFSIMPKNLGRKKLICTKSIQSLKLNLSALCYII